MGRVQKLEGEFRSGRRGALGERAEDEAGPSPTRALRPRRRARVGVDQLFEHGFRSAVTGAAEGLEVASGDGRVDAEAKFEQWPDPTNRQRSAIPTASRASSRAARCAATPCRSLPRRSRPLPEQRCCAGSIAAARGVRVAEQAAALAARNQREFESSGSAPQKVASGVLSARRCTSSAMPSTPGRRKPGSTCTS